MHTLHLIELSGYYSVTTCLFITGLGPRESANLVAFSSSKFDDDGADVTTTSSDEDTLGHDE